MLENLLGSKIKRKILNILFRFPKRSFHVNELRAMTAAVPAKTITSALRDLHRADIVDVSLKRKQRYWSINTYFPFYNEVKDAIAESRNHFEDEVSKRLKTLRELKLIILSGIFTNEPSLSVDILFVGESQARSRLEKIVTDIENLAGQEINYAIMDVEEFDYRRFLHDRLVRDVLDNQHIVLFNSY